MLFQIMILFQKILQELTLTADVNILNMNLNKNKVSMKKIKEKGTP